MKEKKLIPCKVCGKMYEPCAYCQSHADTFRWRNFACSIECANKYVVDAKNFRKKQKDNLSTETTTYSSKEQLYNEGDSHPNMSNYSKKKNSKKTVLNDTKSDESKGDNIEKSNETE